MPGDTKSYPDTPIQLMTQLRNWQRSKITSTCIDDTHCKFNVLSNRLLAIVLGENESKKELCQEVSLLVHGYCDSILDGLSKRSLEMDEQKRALLKKKNFHTHKPNIVGMTSQIFEKIFQSHQEQHRLGEVRRLINSHIFIKSVVVCAAELQFTIYSEKQMQFEGMMEIIGLMPFDLFRILNIFLRLYADMPAKISKQFREIEQRIVCDLAWKRRSPVIRVLEMLRQEPEQTDEKERSRLSPFNYFFVRVLQSSAQTTYEMCQMLDIPEIYQEIIWNLIKSMLSCEPQLLIDRHLD